MFTKINYLYITIIGLLLNSICIAVSDYNLPYKEGELIVKFAPKANGQQKTVSERNQILSSLNAGTIKHSVKLVPGLSLVKLPKNLSVKDALSDFKRRGEFLYVEPNYKIDVASTIPNDTNFSNLWGLHNTGQNDGTVDADIDAPETWDIIHDACDIIVAVIDSGVMYTHPDLAANIWTDANGHHGYDFANGDDDPMDDYGHGTYCAGIIGAVGNNGIGVTGVCWNVKIMALKFIHDTGAGWSYDAISCIDYAVQKGVKILSNSWRLYTYWSNFTDFQALKDAVERAEASGAIFIAAAGNEGIDNDSYTYPAYPASYDCNNIISVMATDQNDIRAIWPEYYASSNYGVTSVDLSAPGKTLSCTLGGDYDYFFGTSSATPYVAGVCALVWANNPSLTYTQVKEAVLNSVDHLDSLEGLCVTEGRLNLYNAVNYWRLLLSQTDDISGCVYPSTATTNRYINYTICYSAGNDVDDVNIVDILPEDVIFISANGNGIYDSGMHQVVWDLGNLDANDSNCLTLTVKVVEDANQGSTIANIAKIYSDGKLIKTAEPVYTAICCFAPIVYVDKNVTGEANDGTSWNNAYYELSDALIAVDAGLHGCANQIWVADGIYKPTDNPYNSSATFQMLDGVDVYGGFDGNETELCQRNLSGNETILTGDIDDDNTVDMSYVVTAANSRLDGLTITKGSYGIYANACSPTIANCVVNYNYNGIYCRIGTVANITNTFVNNNLEMGIYSEDDINIDRCTVSTNAGCNFYVSNGDVNATDSIFSNSTGNSGIYASGCNFTLKDCDISDNSGDTGIRCDGGAAIIQNCRIQRNAGYGLKSQDADKTGIVLKKNIISDNDSVGVYMEGGYNSGGNWQIIDNLIYSNGDNGIKILSGSYYEIEVRNNTIAKNTGYGIYRNTGPEPDVNSNIIYGNTIGGLYGDFTNVHYNCIQSCIEENGNINDDPLFYNADANNFHLTSNSPCKDTGNPSFTPPANETDIDGEPRKVGSYIDRGGDEYYKHPTDFDGNGYTGYQDLDVLCQHWLCSVGSSEPADFDDNNFIDFADFTVFSESWRWVAGWHLDPNIGGQGAYFTTNQCDIPVYEEDPNNEPLPPGPTAVYLVYDGNLTPEPNEDITVYVYSDLPLSSMFIELEVSGDANIIAAMDANDCNQFGWESGWWSDPIIDPNGKLADIFGLDGTIETLGNVGYFVIHYYQGEVNIHISSGDAYDVNEQQILTSDEPIILGAQQQMMMSMPSQSSSSLVSLPIYSAGLSASAEAVEEVFDVNETLDWLDEIWTTDESIREAIDANDWQDFLDAIRNCEE